jgi:hypothetical protein
MRWYQALTLPELTMVLVGRSLGDAFRLPYEMGPDWYGVSADTVARGIHGLQERGLIHVERRFKKAPLSAVGYTAEQRYTLLEPFGPVGHLSGSRSKAKSGGAQADGARGKRAKEAAVPTKGAGSR